MGFQSFLFNFDNEKAGIINLCDSGLKPL